MLYLLFFCSGLSGLIYEVVWVREFGNVFGNTVYSASLVTAVFMLGLGVGGYLVGAWADRRYNTQPESLLQSYGYFELAIAAMGFAISACLPYLGYLSAFTSSYTLDAAGWHVLSAASYLTRGGIAVVLLAPITLLMGGTLTLLIRHLVRKDLGVAGWRTALLYSVNTAGAALGCFLTDFALVPAAGLRGAQGVAVLVNLVAAAGALRLASCAIKTPARAGEPVRTQGARLKAQGSARGAASDVVLVDARRATVLTGLAIGLSGFAAMGMEILWFRHFTLLLGGFRAVFSLLLTVILVGIGLGSLTGGWLSRRATQPAAWLILVQGVFVASMLFGLASADLEDVLATTRTLLASTPSGDSLLVGTVVEQWLNARPILLEVGAPALLMGFAFPLANAVIQRAEPSVGRLAGVLYLSNTIGAVCGVLAAGFVFLPSLGIQGSAVILAVAGGLAAVPLYLTTRRIAPERSATRLALAALTTSLVLSAVAVGLWLRLPADYVIGRASVRPRPNERVLALKEGVTEVIAVTEVPGEGRQLLTDGHAMSATSRMSQRYMRALAHIPLLLIDRPETALVIGFGVGNTLHAATLHPSIRRVEVADLSRQILTHASYFNEANRSVLNDPRVAVYVNDGRQHLRMQPAASYDLITLEPPPLTLSGVGALYSKEFYALARARLKPTGYVSQWLPFYQVPPATLPSMIRAFVDVFPHAVLLGGTDEELLLIGTKGSQLEIDPAHLTAALSRAPLVQADLQRLDLGSVRAIVGTFVASARTMAQATLRSPPVSDDRPMQEYGTRSRLTAVRIEGVPASIVDLSQVPAWCPKCFAGGKPVGLAEGLDTYLALLDPVYKRLTLLAGASGGVADSRTQRLIEDSAYLSMVLSDRATRQNVRGVALATEGRLDEAIMEFQSALRFNPDSAETHWNMGRAFLSRGAPEFAIEHLRRSVELDPSHGPARYDFGSALLDFQQLDDAVEQLRAAIRLMPTSAEAHNNLGIALGSQGKLVQAIDEFEEALRLQPESERARRNLTMAREAVGRGSPGR